ncbi:MAG: tetraacyldisaccharide 4'-kinase [Gemmataceae bacterium]
MNGVADYIDLISGRKRGLAAALKRAALLAASWSYGTWMVGRNALFDRGWRRCHSAAVPVISVGNLTVGGTGKTPCVEYVARFYRQRYLQVAILSRGYGSDSGPNDEALLLEENLPDVPHLQGADRVALAATAVEELDSELLVLDDGFQHRRLTRTLDLVLIDATRPWGFGHLLPRGLLRESPGSLRRAGAVLLTRCDGVSVSELAKLRSGVARFAPAVPIVESIHKPLAWVNADGQERPVESLRGQSVLAFCGIGNPESFRRTLGQIGIAVTDFRAFPDHHAYRRADVEGLERWAEAAAAGAVVLTTQKDLVKLRITQLAGHELWALRIGLFVTKGETELHDLLARAVHG